MYLTKGRQRGVIERFAIGGAFAAILHNEPISPVDVDIFFFLSEKKERLVLSLEPVYAFARKHGFQFDHEFINVHGWLLQFVEASHNPLWADAVSEAGQKHLEELSVPVIDAEYLVAMWLFAGRLKDYQKIAAFMEAGILDEPRLKMLLNKYGLLLKWEREKWRFAESPDEQH